MRSRPKASAAERGYGHEHRRARASWVSLVATGAVSCARCGWAILPGQAWDLDHAPGKMTYLGPSHRRCNRSAGATAGNVARGRRRALIRAVTGNPSRAW